MVVIVQENRTVDNLFNGFPGADTVKMGQNLQGQTIELRAHPLRRAIRHVAQTFGVAGRLPRRQNERLQTPRANTAIRPGSAHRTTSRRTATCRAAT